MISDTGCAAPVHVPTRAICGAWLALRAEAASLQDLKRRVNELNRNRSAAAGGGSTPTDVTPLSVTGVTNYTPGSGELDDGNRTKRIKIKVHCNRSNAQASCSCMVD